MFKILIADDSQLVREHLAAMLMELDGIQLVGQAENVREMVAAIQRTHPDLVILDIRMPDGSSIEALPRLKQSNHPPTIVMLTAFPYPQYRERCIAAGADFFFDKATEYDRVIQIISNLAQSQLAQGESEDGNGMRALRF